MPNKFLKIILFVGIAFFFLGGNVSAIELKQNTVSIKARPLTPRPGQITYISLGSAEDIVDLKRSEITWIVNGEILEKGIGKKSIQIKAGEVGSIYDVDALVRTSNNDFVTKSISFISQEISILWEADTYTHPFYKGKALDTAGSLVKLVAIPNIVDRNGNKIPEKDLIYEWYVEGTFAKALSGIGENVYFLRSETIPITTTVKLKVSSFDEKIELNSSTKLKISNSKVLLYESNPLFGVLFNKALEENIFIDKNEISVAPYPFFFSTDSRTSSSLSYTWFVGDRVISTPKETGGFITFARPSEEGGKSITSLLLSNSRNRHQKVGKDLSFEF